MRVNPPAIESSDSFTVVSACRRVFLAASIRLHGAEVFGENAEPCSVYSPSGFLRGQSIVTESVIHVGLLDPLTECLGRHLQLSADRGHAFAADSDEADGLSPKLGRIRGVTLRHRYMLSGTLDPK